MALAAAMAAVEDLTTCDRGADFDEVGARWSDQVRPALRVLESSFGHTHKCHINRQGHRDT